MIKKNLWEILLLKDSASGLIPSSYCPPCSSTTEGTNDIKVESFVLRMQSSSKDTIGILIPTKVTGILTSTSGLFWLDSEQQLRAPKSVKGKWVYAGNLWPHCCILGCLWRPQISWSIDPKATKMCGSLTLLSWFSWSQIHLSYWRRLNKCLII